MKETLMVKKFLLPMLALTALSLSACGSLPAADDELGSMSLLSAEGGAGQSADKAHFGPQRGRGMHGKGGPGGRGDHGFSGFGMMGLGHFGDLGLTEDQTAKFKTLQQEARAFFEAHKPADSARADHEASRKAFEEAFKSDHFDPAALAANRPQRPAPDAAMLDFQVEQIVKAHGILTPAQRAKLAAGNDKSSQDRPAPPAGASDRQSAHLDKLATELSLSADQKSKLSALFKAEAESRAQNWESRKAEMDAKRKALSGILTQASIDKAALKAALAERFNSAPGKDGHLDQLAKIHAVLSPEQRAKFITLGGKDFGGPGGPGGHGGRGGHRGGHRGHGGR